MKIMWVTTNTCKMPKSVVGTRKHYVCCCDDDENENEDGDDDDDAFGKIAFSSFLVSVS